MADARNGQSAAAGGTDRARRTAASAAGRAASGTTASGRKSAASARRRSSAGRDSASGSRASGGANGVDGGARSFSARDRWAEAEADADADGGGAPRANPLSGGHVCPVAFCPVGMALTFAEAARPEVVQHLMAAGQELMLAVKAMIDARAEAVANASGLEHIRIR